MSARSRESLRDFQTHLAARLKLAQAQTGTASKLGFIAGGRHWLVNLDQVSEVVTVPDLTSVPLGKPWFAGVANVRGMIYGCTDLAAFLDLAAPMPRGEARLLLLNPEFGINAAWRVERALGLRALDRLTRATERADTPAWMPARWIDADGLEWSEIDFAYLVSLPEFLEAGLE